MRFGDVAGSGIVVMVLVSDCHDKLILDDRIDWGGTKGYNHIGLVLDDWKTASGLYPLFGTAWFASSWKVVDRVPGL